MKKYIIIETWNGEGYTDSDAKIMGFKSELEAMNHCIKKAREAAGEAGKISDPDADACIYEIGDDAGAYHFVEYTEDIIGVVLNPCINDYEVITNKKDWSNALDTANNLGSLEDDELEEWEEFCEGKSDRVYVHSGRGDGDALIISFEDKEERLEFYEAGDGVEHEVWKDKITGELYEVPIEIVRDFDNITKL